MLHPTYHKKQIARSFNQAALATTDAVEIPHEIGDRLFEPLDYIRLDPKIILDLGAGTGFFSEKLSQQYPESKIIAYDIAEKALMQAKKKFQKNAKIAYISGDSEQLPFSDHTVDFVFANLLLPWCNNLTQLFSEIHRVLKSTGLFLFSTLGPDTLKELRESFQAVDEQTHVHPFLDMHLIGDQLLQTRFADPVMHRETLIITYPTVDKLCQDIKSLGMHNLDSRRSKGLFSPRKFQAMQSYYEAHFRDEANQIPATLEVIYGHAWISAPNEVRIPVSMIQKGNS